MGVAVQTCMSGSITSCMDSALVHGMVFIIQLDYATTLPDGSTPGKSSCSSQMGRREWSSPATPARPSPSTARGRCWWLQPPKLAPFKCRFTPENSDQGVYDDYASYVVRGLGSLHFLLPEVYVMDGASTTQSRGAIVLHSSARGDMAGQFALEHLIEPFISNSLSEPLIYETTYKGIVTSQVFTTDDVKVEFGNGVYNDHHYHFGYWITALIVLKKLGPIWTGMAQVETMVVTLLRDVSNPHKS
ncbi:Endo-1,3(4)-beta-glucanase [Phytophthora cactorum]|nr:Endo-1,3(4)-beta-glucanase [Phytophthora cactorum]